MNVIDYVKCDMTDVRPNALLCKRCMEWKPDDAFYRNTLKRRRNRATTCRECHKGVYRNGGRTFEALWARIADKQGRILERGGE